MQNKNWIWFFVAIFLLGVAAIGVNYWVNMSQQLKPEQLKAAQVLWKEKGPPSYDWRIRKEINPAAGGNAEREEIIANVRSGQVIKATLNGKELEQRLLPKYDVSAWFDYFNEFMEIDTKPNAPKVYCSGTFDPVDGHPVRYVRRVMGTRERVEVQFELTPLR